MNCPACGRPLETGARFCGECGHALTMSADDPTITDRPLPGGAVSTLDPATAPYGAEPAFGGNDPLIGQTIIGQFEVGAVIGAGGMGRVYGAVQPSVGRRAAIKVLSPSLGADPERIARFRQEAQAAASLTSPHVVDIYASGLLDDGTPFMAMEWIDGRTLTDLLRGGPLPPERAVHIATSICDVLDEAHRVGIVHRDLKPSNVMLIERGGDPDYVKVLDFGVAKLHDGGLTREGAMFGTPQYMSPEQLRGETSLDGRADLYSLGLIVYAMLTGQPPFVASTPVAYVHKHLAEAPPPLPLNVPPALAGVILGALAKDRDARPPTAAALREQLFAALGPPASGDEERSGFRGVIGALAGLAVIASLGGGAWWWTSRTDRGATDTLTERTEVDDDDDGDPSRPSTGASEAGTMTDTAAETGAPSAEADSSTSLDETSGPSVLPPDTSAETDTESETGPPETRPHGPLSPLMEELLDKDLAWLEQELRRTVEGALIPPSSGRQILDGYELHKRSTPVGPEHDERLKSYLVQIIAAYRNPQLIAKKGDRMSVSELRKVFLTMKMKKENPIPPAIRETMLKDSMSGYDAMEVSDDDKEHYRRVQLAGLIRTLAADPQIIDR